MIKTKKDNLISVIKTREEFTLFAIKKILAPQRIKVLQTINDGESDLLKLAKKCSISSPLLSYHINGNLKSEGLIELGLVQRTHDAKGIMTGITITDLGKEILKIIK